MTLLVTGPYGQPHEVRSCLDSLIRSSYRNIVILVLGDPANRSVAAVVRSYARWDPRIRIVEHPTRLPPRPESSSSNGHYLMVVEAPARLEKDAVAELVKVLRLSGSDFAVGRVDDDSDATSSTAADSWREHGADRLGQTVVTCPDHPAADTMTGKLFRSCFLTDLGWSVGAAPTTDQRDLVDRAYQLGHFDLVMRRVVRWQGPAGPEDRSSSLT